MSDSDSDVVSIAPLETPPLGKRKLEEAHLEEEEGSARGDKRVPFKRVRRPAEEPFHLRESFLREWSQKEPKFGYDGLGEYIHFTKYSRTLEDGSKEAWWQTCKRVIEGTFRMQQNWMKERRMGWAPKVAQREAEELYERMFQMKWLPPGRGIQAMGAPNTEEKHLFAALNNCGFVSTKDIHEDPSKPFCFLMDHSMLGVGVGFDTLAASKEALSSGKGVPVYGPDNNSSSLSIFEIPDTREGWVESLKLLLDSYFVEELQSCGPIVFDYSKVRPKGTPLKGFGGVASGPEPLKRLHENVRRVLEDLRGKVLTVTAIMDIFNLVGTCVAAGGIRRSAEIGFGEHDSDEFIALKDYEKNPTRAYWGHASNNSIFAELGMDYGKAFEQVAKMGEPGFAFLENMRKFGRMADPENNKDYRAAGGNPCLEQTLENYELCCLVIIFPMAHETLEDFKASLRCALLYAKTVTLATTHWEETNKVLQRNRRIGAGLSGLAEFRDIRGVHTLRQWCQEGYSLVRALDREFSGRWGVGESIKLTCVKPDGTATLMTGHTPGITFPEARFYIRRVREKSGSPALLAAAKAGYRVNKVTPQEDPTGETWVICFPCRAPAGVRTAAEVSAAEQLEFAQFMQEYWADNQVSTTITFYPSEAKQLRYLMDFAQYKLKGVSFLPRSEDSSIVCYENAPYEAITEEAYHSMKAEIREKIDYAGATREFVLGKRSREELEPVPDAGCTTEKCMRTKM